MWIENSKFDCPCLISINKRDIFALDLLHRYKSALVTLLQNIAKNRYHLKLLIVVIKILILDFHTFILSIEKAGKASPQKPELEINKRRMLFQIRENFSCYGNCVLLN